MKTLIAFAVLCIAVAYAQYQYQQPGMYGQYGGQYSPLAGQFGGQYNPLAGQFGGQYGMYNQIPYGANQYGMGVQGMNPFANPFQQYGGFPQYGGYGQQYGQYGLGQQYPYGAQGQLGGGFYGGAQAFNPAFRGGVFGKK